MSKIDETCREIYRLSCAYIRSKIIERVKTDSVWVHINDDGDLEVKLRIRQDIRFETVVPNYVYNHIRYNLDPDKVVNDILRDYKKAILRRYFY